MLHLSSPDCTLGWHRAQTRDTMGWLSIGLTAFFGSGRDAPAPYDLSVDVPFPIPMCVVPTGDYFVLTLFFFKKKGNLLFSDLMSEKVDFCPSICAQFSWTNATCGALDLVLSWCCTGPTDAVHVCTVLDATSISLRATWADDVLSFRKKKIKVGQFFRNFF